MENFYAVAGQRRVAFYYLERQQSCSHYSYKHLGTFSILTFWTAALLRVVVEQRQFLGLPDLAAGPLDVNVIEEESPILRAYRGEQLHDAIEQLRVYVRLIRDADSAESAR